MVAAVVGLVWYVTRIPFFSITEVQVTGGDTISKDYIHSRVEDQLRGSYFLLIPKRFSYLYPREDIIASVVSVSKVKAVDVDRPSRTRVDVTFLEYVPHALLCREESEECWFIDEEGYAFSVAPDLQGGGLVRHQLRGQGEIRLGQAIPSERLHAIDTFAEKVAEEFDFRIGLVTHKVDGDIEFHIQGGGMILVSGNRDFATTFDNLRTVLSAAEFEHIESGNFNYIDVRFENKIFVNEELPKPEVLEEASTTTLSE